MQLSVALSFTFAVQAIADPILGRSARFLRKQAELIHDVTKNVYQPQRRQLSDTTIKLEAEDGELGGAAKTATSNGVTLVGWMEHGASCTITADVPQGFYNLDIEYASAYGTDPRNVWLEINGVSIQKVSYPVTGSWWRMETASVRRIYLDEGVNTIGFVVKGPNSGYINLDFIELTPTIFRIQAEDGGLVEPAAVTDKYAGFHGNGFVGWFQRGTGAKDTLTADHVSAGFYALDIRYAAATQGDCTLSLVVNHVDVGQVTYPGTGSWTTWATKKFPLIKLKDGKNRIEFVVQGGDSGGINLDYVDLNPASLRVQAEDGELGGTAAVTDIHAGYDGEGFIGWMNVGSSDILEADVPEAAYSIDIRYAAGHGTTPRTVSLVVNDFDVGQVVYPTTGGWAKYATVSGPVIHLHEGKNKIGFVVDGDDSGIINLDYIDLKRVGPYVHPGKVRIEAEEGELGGKAKTATNRGITLVGWMEDKSSCTLTADVPAGFYNLDIEYASAYGTEPRTVWLEINGVNKGKVSYPVTGNWWGMRTLSGPLVQLEEGKNTIAFVVRGAGSGYINLDFIELTPTSLRLQAEDGSLVAPAGVTDKYPGFDGSGFVGWFHGGTGAKDILKADVSAGFYALDIRYAAATHGTRTLSLVVNSVDVGQVSYPGTGSWTNWANTEFPVVKLKEGTNEIGFVVEGGDSGGINLDYVDLTPTSLRLQAEDGKRAGTAGVTDKYAGFDGSGFIGWMNRGSSVILQADVPVGTYALDIRYACSGSASKTVSLVVNEVDVGQVVYPATGSWAKWATEPGPLIKLKEGINTIGFVVDSDDTGVINLDYIDLRRVRAVDDKNFNVKVCTATAWGDPHIVTFDGLKFDAQAKGEAIFLKDTTSTMEVQGRTTKINANAAVTTGIAMRGTSPTHPVIQVSMATVAGAPNTVTSLQRVPCPVEIYIDGENLNQANMQYTAGEGGPTVGLVGSTIQVEYPSLLLAEMTVSYYANTCYFSVDVSLLDCEPLEDKVIGLLGSPNGNARDDWMKKDGSIIPIPSGASSFFFGPAFNYVKENWILTDENDSLFGYEKDKSFSDVSDPGETYDPSVEEKIKNVDDEVKRVCGENIGCLVDGVTLGKEAAEEFQSNPASQRTMQTRSIERDPGGGDGDGDDEDEDEEELCVDVEEEEL